MPPKYWRSKHPIKSFQAAPPSRFRRILRLFFNPLTFSLAALLFLAAFLTATYFWFEYSDAIDRRLLSGEVYTPSAGIYSAPKTIKSGEDLTPDDLVNYLKSAGYVEKSSQADASRSRYQIGDGQIEVEPGATAAIDGAKVFHALTVKFKKDNKSIQAIGDKDSGSVVAQTQLEPRILSSLAEEGDGRRKAVKFTDLPDNLVKAVTATEDRAFFEHYGVNFRGIARALWRRYEGDADSPLARQGGSSITQQLVKNLLLTNEPTVERKIKEAYMSVILETRLSKQDIFTLYANQIYLGQQAGVSIYGVGEAANVYFGKDVSQLTLPESALIAGIIRSPNRYNPYKNYEKVTERRNQVLDSMVEANVISADAAANAKNVKLELHQMDAKRDLQGMPYFSQYAIEELPKLINDPEAVKHLRVYTTIDPDLQRVAYETVNKRLEKLDKLFAKTNKGKLNAALVAIRPKTGEIVAMVGGRNYLENQFNRATDAQRQPGSVFKPFVYATAINSVYDGNAQTFTTATIFKDEKKVFNYGTETYAPNNYGDTFSNKDYTLRDALVKSKNTITVDLGMQLNIGKVMSLAAKAGLPKVEKAYPSMALGTSEVTPLEMASAYTTFANLGQRVAPLPISRITNGEGKIVVAPVAEKKTVLRPEVAYIMDDMLKDVINRGTAVEAQAWGFKNIEGKQAFAGKTGTSRDGWFAGFTPDLVCVVYVGFDNGDDLGMKGADSAMPIWADFMREALNEHPEWNGDWQQPDNVRKAEIDTRDGKLIRELNDSQAAQVKAEQTALKKAAADKKKTAANNPNEITDENAVIPDNKEIYVTNVPPEFRRVELFILGTVPNKTLLPVDEAAVDTSENLAPAAKPTETPFTTWQNSQNNQKGNTNSGKEIPAAVEPERTVTVMVCDLTGDRATSNCPDKHPQTFKEGAEPKNFCRFHVNPPK